MAKYIDAEAAIAIPITTKENRNYQTLNLDDAYELGWLDLEKRIRQLPAADVVEVLTVDDVLRWCEPRNYALVAKEDFPDMMEVRHGKWEPIVIGGEVWGTQCSKCHAIDLYGKTAYCPHCGARMEGVEE